MDYCPPELHSYIAYLACLTDHGPTIRSLSLVSRYFHDISAPYLYHTISLQNEETIFSLLQKLDTLAPSSRRNIRHLFLSYPQPKSPQPNAKLQNAIIRLVTLCAPNAKLQNAIIRLVTLCAPSLHTLTLDASQNLAQSPALLSRIWRTRFPELRNLTISGFYPFPTSTTPSQPNFPRLTHLHLHGNRNPHGLLQFGGLSKSCPNLTHLKVSGLSMAVTFAMELQEAMTASGSRDGSPAESRDSDPWDDLRFSTSPLSSAITSSQTSLPSLSALPPKLTRLTVEPAPELEVTGRGYHPTAWMKDRSMMEALRGIAKEACNADGEGETSGEDSCGLQGDVHGISYTLLSRPSRPRDSNYFRDDWRDQVEGTTTTW
ncbi:hypothetical protein CC2G_013434 [Coprinopsis cinerea AmutBmut pab1-1]|nr:hypothetical protein CC2G_013434 [Coprinopsis cinerea AmutBmut pab1-1]